MSTKILTQADMAEIGKRVSDRMRGDEPLKDVVRRALIRSYSSPEASFINFDLHRVTPADQLPPPKAE